MNEPSAQEPGFRKKVQKSIALALTFGLPLSAQGGLSLADAVNRGLTSHFKLKAANAKVASAEGIRSQGVLRPNPRLFLQSENSRFGGTPPFSYSRDADTFVYSSLVFETAGKLQKRRQFQDEGVKRGELERDLTASQIIYRISVAYWTALGAERNSQVLLNNLNNFQRIVEYHRDRVREGAMAEADLLRVLLEHEKLALSLRSAEQEARRSRILPCPKTTKRFPAVL